MYSGFKKSLPGKPGGVMRKETYKGCGDSPFETDAVVLKHEDGNQKGGTLSNRKVATRAWFGFTLRNWGRT